MENLINTREKISFTIASIVGIASFLFCDSIIESHNFAMNAALGVTDFDNIFINILFALWKTGLFYFFPFVLEGMIIYHTIESIIRCHYNK